MNRPLANDFANRTSSLAGRSVAILATDGVELDELTRAKRALELAGARAIVVGPKPGPIVGFRQLEPIGEHTVDVPLDATSASSYGGVFIPGGALHADALRCMPRVVEFVRRVVTNGLPVALLGHAASLLIEAGVARGREVSAWPSVKTDLTNAGADWVDRDVVKDGTLLSGRAVTAFYEALCQHMAQETPTNPTSTSFLARLFSSPLTEANAGRTSD
jgi:protease I